MKTLSIMSYAVQVTFPCTDRSFTKHFKFDLDGAFRFASQLAARFPTIPADRINVVECMIEG